GRLLPEPQALSERRLLLGRHLRGDGLPHRHVPGAVRDPAHRRMDRPVARDGPGRGAEDRAAAPDLSRLRATRLRADRGARGGRGVTRAWIALAALLAGVASAEEARDHPAPPAIRVVGEGRVTVKPDQAQLDVGVTTQAESAQAAGTQNARKVDAVLAAVKKTAGAGADIKTVGYSLSANYRYPKEGGQPAVTGYTASNVVQIRTG